MDLIHRGGIPIWRDRIRCHSESLEDQAKAKHVPALQKGFCGLLGDSGVLGVQQQQVQNSGNVARFGMRCQTPACGSPH